MLYYASSDYLAHFGVPGMKWGVRKARPSSGNPRVARAREAMRTANRNYNAAYKEAYRFSTRHPISQHIKSSKNYKKSNELWYKTYDTAKAANSAKKAYKNAKNKARADKSGSSSNAKKYIAIGAGLAAAGLATYGAVKYSKYIKNTAGEHAYKRGEAIAKRFYDLQYKHGTTAADFYGKARDTLSSRKAQEYRSTAEYFVKRAHENAVNGDLAIKNGLNKSVALKNGSTRDAYKYLRENGYNILGRKKKL